MSDEFIRPFLDAPDTREVIEWLGEATEDHFRSLGESASTEDSIALAKEIYAAGAVEVLAVEIDEDDDGDNTGKLVIKLPTDPGDRKRVFAWAGAVSESHGFDPTEDSGQSYLFVMLD
jgi:hypothetical protein